MKTSTANVLGFTLNLAFPETLAEAVELCGGEERALQHINAQVKAHFMLGDARACLVEALEEATGNARRTKGTGRFRGEGEQREEITEWAETEAEYVNRLAAEAGGTVEELAQAYASIIADLSAGGSKEISFASNAKGGTRQPGAPRKLPKWALDQAAGVISAGKQEAWVAKFGGTGTVEEIAKFLHEKYLAELAAAKASAQAATAGLV